MELLKRLGKQLVFDAVLWTCIYQMITKGSYETQAYNLVFFCSTFTFVIMMISIFDFDQMANVLVESTYQKNSMTTIKTMKAYGNISTGLEVMVLVAFGYTWIATAMLVSLVILRTTQSKAEEIFNG